MIEVSNNVVAGCFIIYALLCLINIILFFLHIHLRARLNHLGDISVGVIQMMLNVVNKKFVYVEPPKKIITTTKKGVKLELQSHKHDWAGNFSF